MTIQNVICDIDGVLMHDNVPGAAEFIKRILEKEMPLVMLTNYPSQTGQDLANRFATAGIDVPDTAFIPQQWPRRIFCVARKAKKAYGRGRALIHELYKAGFTITDVNPDFVIVGETRPLTGEMMHKASLFFVANGARFIATNPDTHGRGYYQACGALCAGIEKNLRS